MTKIVTLAAATMIAAATLAAPAAAQSFDPDAGTGNVLQFSFTPIAPQNNSPRPSSHRMTAARQSGLHAFARVPDGQPAAAASDPARTGGGSLGYNQMLLSY